MTSEQIKQFAGILNDNIKGFEDRTIQRIGERIKAIGRVNSADLQALKNLSNITTDIELIKKDLANVIGINAQQMNALFKKLSIDNLEKYRGIYKAKGIEFIPFENNETMQALVILFAKQTAGDMVNLGKSKGLRINSYDLNGNLIASESLKGFYQSAIDKAIFNVTSGTQPYQEAMSDAIKSIGNGLKVDYGDGVTRSLESVTRANILYSVKQFQVEQNNVIGEELGCDGFEVNFSATCRPEHAFMEGEMFSYNGDKTVNGITYHDGTEALERLSDYGCNHTKTDVILGVSEPSYDKEFIKLNQERNNQLLTYDDKTKTRYDWIEQQRQIERAIREETKQSLAYESAGFDLEAHKHNDKIRALKDKYNDLTDKLDLQPTKERMAIK